MAKLWDFASKAEPFDLKDIVAALSEIEVSWCSLFITCVGLGCISLFTGASDTAERIRTRTKRGAEETTCTT